jgi:4-alpha-glucanotransferase
MGVAGYRVLRWEKEGDDYRDPATWPAASAATNSTHDTDTTAEWYDGLALEEREKLRHIPALQSVDPAQPFGDGPRDLILRAIYQAPSTLALVPFQDALGTRDRINTPGTTGPENWSYRTHVTVDELLADEATCERLTELAVDAGRTPAKRG